VNLKCDPDLALALRDQYDQVQPGYHINKKHWNTVEIGSGIPDAEPCKMIDHSYELIVGPAKKDARKITTLAPDAKPRVIARRRFAIGALRVRHAEKCPARQSARVRVLRPFPLARAVIVDLTARE
jgi:YjbR